MAEDTDRIKSEFEAKISGYTESGKAAARSSWNAALDKVRAVLVSKIAAINALKVSDAIVNAKLTALASTSSAASSGIKNNIMDPASKMLSSFSSERLTNLKKTMSGTTSDSNRYASSMSSVLKRNEFNKTKSEEQENNLKRDIETIDQLKF